MDDGYPPEKTPSKEWQTCGQRQAEHEPGGHGLKALLRGTRNQHRGGEWSELGGERRPTYVLEWTIFNLNACSLCKYEGNLSVRMSNYFLPLRRLSFLYFILFMLIIMLLMLNNKQHVKFSCGGNQHLHGWLSNVPLDGLSIHCMLGYAPSFDSSQVVSAPWTDSGTFREKLRNKRRFFCMCSFHQQ